MCFLFGPDFAYDLAKNEFRAKKESESMRFGGRVMSSPWLPPQTKLRALELVVRMGSLHRLPSQIMGISCIFTAQHLK